jgi:ribonuclease P protein component
VTQGSFDRLTDGRAIAAVLRGRRQRPGHLAVVHVATDRTSGAARLAVVASRRVGDAVTRNRAKRLLREAARRLPWRPGTDVVLVARGACAESDLAHVLAEIRRSATELDVLEPTDDLVALHETS